MKCLSPFFLRSRGILVPCGKCKSCRINRRKEWVVRCDLEFLEHDYSSFITLTYDPEHEPLNGSLVVEHLQAFWKRLRKAGLKFRYFACGEYGTKTHRPHYHAILFGVDFVTADFFVRKFWDYGFAYCTEANSKTAGYVAGYCTKKLGNVKTNMELKDLGLRPEFIVMSRRPSIGAASIERLKKYALAQGKFDVISVLKKGSEIVSVPRYIKNKLREALFDEDYLHKLKIARVENLQEELENLVFKHTGKRMVTAETAKESYSKTVEGLTASVFAKDRIYNNRSKI